MQKNVIKYSKYERMVTMDITNQLKVLNSDLETINNIWRLLRHR